MKNTLVAALGASMLMTVGAVSGAHAALINFSAGVFGGTTSFTGSSLDKSTAFNLDSALLVVGETGKGDQSGLAHFDTIDISPSNIVYGSGTGSSPLATDVIKSWTSTGGDHFTETLTTVDSINRKTTNAITIDLSGTVSDTSGLFVDVPIFLIFSATQVGGAGSAISATFTDTSEVGTVPEAPTWAMMALGFAALGYAASRRTKSVRALSA